jgi:hypothetical protein
MLRQRCGWSCRSSKGVVQHPSGSASSPSASSASWGTASLKGFCASFPHVLMAQEVSTERYIAIPEAVREVLDLWRPSPLMRASRWEKSLHLPENVKIYYKYEGGSPIVDPTKPTRPCRRSTTTKRRALQRSPRKLELVNGALPWPGRAPSSTCP